MPEATSYERVFYADLPKELKFFCTNDGILIISKRLKGVQDDDIDKAIFEQQVFLRRSRLSERSA